MNVCPITRRLSEERGVAVLRTKLITKHFINAATIIMENLMAPHMHVQGTMVEIMGMGVLIEGAPGMGKSETALALIKKGHALVSDDVTALRRDSAGAIVAAPTDVTRYHMEIRGVGIIHVPSLFGVASVREEKKLDVVATLVHPGSTGDEDRGGGMRTTREFLGVTIPQVLVRVAPGRDIANVIEAAALDLKLRRLGHDAAKELDEHLIELLKGGGRNVSE
jgi:HPr kinase/phosphorylase